MDEFFDSDRAIWLVIGIAIGTGFGVALHNIALGFAIGIGIGAAMMVIRPDEEESADRQSDDRHESTPDD